MPVKPYMQTYGIAMSHSHIDYIFLSIDDI